MGSTNAQAYTCSWPPGRSSLRGRRIWSVISNFLRINVNAGGGGNTIAVNGDSLGSITSLNAGTGINTIAVGNGTLAGILGALNINGGNAISAISVNNAAGPAAAMTITNNTILSSAAVITYATALSLTVNAPSNISVLSTSIITNLNGPAGSTITIGNNLSGAFWGHQGRPSTSRPARRWARSIW